MVPGPAPSQAEAACARVWRPVPRRRAVLAAESGARGARLRARGVPHAGQCPPPEPALPWGVPTRRAPPAGRLVCTPRQCTRVRQATALSGAPVSTAVLLGATHTRRPRGTRPAANVGADGRGPEWRRRGAHGGRGHTCLTIKAAVLGPGGRVWERRRPSAPTLDSGLQSGSHVPLGRARLPA